MRFLLKIKTFKKMIYAASPPSLICYPRFQAMKKLQLQLENEDFVENLCSSLLSLRCFHLNTSQPNEQNSRGFVSFSKRLLQPLTWLREFRLLRTSSEQWETNTGFYQLQAFPYNEVYQIRRTRIDTNLFTAATVTRVGKEFKMDKQLIHEIPIETLLWSRCTTTKAHAFILNHNYLQPVDWQWIRCRNNFLTFAFLTWRFGESVKVRHQRLLRWSRVCFDVCVVVKVRWFFNFF